MRPRGGASVGARGSLLRHILKRPRRAARACAGSVREACAQPRTGCGNAEFKSDEIRNDTYFLDIVKNGRIIIAYSRSTAGVPFSASLQTVTFEATGSGTMLTLTEQATFLPGSDGVANRRQGTETLLDSLAHELEQSAAG